MACSTNSAVSRMQVAPPNSMGSDAFGAGCTTGCGFPMDCGDNYPTFQYQAQSLGSCLFQPPHAVSKLNMPVCQTCDQDLSACYSSIPTPQGMVMAAVRPQSTCS